ncbi:MAG: hypothetical protein AABW54_03455 [Candidatus Micrarchaeota archaeon]
MARSGQVHKPVLTVEEHRQLGLRELPKGKKVAVTKRFEFTLAEFCRFPEGRRPKTREELLMHTKARYLNNFLRFMPGWYGRRHLALALRKLFLPSTARDEIAAHNAVNLACLELKFDQQDWVRRFSQNNAIRNREPSRDREMELRAELWPVFITALKKPSVKHVRYLT